MNTHFMSIYELMCTSAFKEGGKGREPYYFINLIQVAQVLIERMSFDRSVPWVTALRPPRPSNPK